MNKTIGGADDAVAQIPDGATVMVGGANLVGIPENLIAALHRRGARDLTIISNTAGVEDFGVGLLIGAGQVRKLVANFVGDNRDVARRSADGSLDLELIPSGTFAERIRAAGAGIGAFFTPTGYGTVAADGKETRLIDGRPHLLEMPLGADFALVKAYRGDTLGNLTYRKTARNFNPVMATAGRFTIAEVEELVPAGAIDPDTVVTPGIFVQRLFAGAAYEKRIQHLRTRGDAAERPNGARERIARRVALELRDGEYVNLGLGIPSLVAEYLPPSVSIVVHTANGMLGVGPYPLPSEVDPDLTNASRETVSEALGCSYSDSTASFAMVRGGHLDVTVLGALEVDTLGNLANWMIPGQLMRGMGGAMDLVVGAKRVIVAMEHTAPDGSPRIRTRCTLPLTGARVVSTIVTELAVIDVAERGLVLREVAEGISIQDVRRATEAELIVPPSIG